MAGRGGPEAAGEVLLAPGAMPPVGDAGALDVAEAPWDCGAAVRVDAPEVAEVWPVAAVLPQPSSSPPPSSTSAIRPASGARRPLWDLVSDIGAGGSGVKGSWRDRVNHYPSFRKYCRAYVSE